MTRTVTGYNCAVFFPDVFMQFYHVWFILVHAFLFGKFISQMEVAFFNKLKTKKSAVFLFDSQSTAFNETFDCLVQYTNYFAKA